MGAGESALFLGRRSKSAPRPAAPTDNTSMIRELSFHRCTAASASFVLIAIACSAKESPLPTAGPEEPPAAPATGGMGDDDAAPSGSNERAELSAPGCQLVNETVDSIEIVLSAIEESLGRVAPGESIRLSGHFEVRGAGAPLTGFCPEGGVVAIAKVQGQLRAVAEDGGDASEGKALESTAPSGHRSHETWRRELESVTVYRVHEHGGWIRGEQLAQPSTDWGHRLLAEIDQAPAPEARRKRCAFEPGVEVVFRAGDEEAHVRLCFSCGDLAVRLPGQRDFGPLQDFMPRQAEIERLVRRVIPGDDLER
jgi:hypothetical protein